MHIKKVSIIGEGGVGKTSLVERIIKNTFTPKYIPTLGSETTEFNNLEIWDTAGQEKYAGLKEGYILDSDYVIVMFTRYKFNSLSKFINTSKRFTPNAKIILVCNKTDSEGKVNKNIMQQYIQKRGDINKYFEISCKNNIGCEEVISYINRRVLVPASV